MRLFPLLFLLAACRHDAKPDTGSVDTSVDADQDGWTLPDDCDDTDASIHPDAVEVCDGVDNNCDGATDEGVTHVFFTDGDADGFGDPLGRVEACDQPAGCVPVGNDCDDTRDDVYPGATEACDGADNNCDGDIDEGVTHVTYTDADGDGYGDPASAHEACTPPVGTVDNAEDCDDADPEATPETRWYLDRDADGYGSPTDVLQQCTQPFAYVIDDTDCDDADVAVNPAAAEVCNGTDDDCDGATDEGVLTTFYADTDADGYGDPASPAEACSASDGYVPDATDCDDTTSAVFPGATETCDERDNDCDSAIDEGVMSTFFADGDGDGYGDASVTTETCFRPAGYTDDDTDCDDTRVLVHPLAIEVCDGLDDDCDGTVDEGVLSTWYADADADGYGDLSVTAEACTAGSGWVATATDCDDALASVHPDAAEVCDGIDDDCDGVVDEDVLSTFYADTDADGYGDASTTTGACTAPAGFTADDTDCDDTDAAVNPGAVEVCNGIDEDCDGWADTGSFSTFYADIDADGYGDASATTEACTAPAGFTADDTDCDDADAAIHPGADEVCDDLDDDCDGSVDEDVLSTFFADADADGWGDPGTFILACVAPDGWLSDDTDCDDTDAEISPSAVEECDGVDNDCDGEIDLLASWEFDEGSGATVADSSGHGLDGTLNDGSSAWTTGVSGTALSSAGYGAPRFAEVGDDRWLDLGGAFTIGTWVKIAGSTSDHQVLVSKWYSGGSPLQSYVFELQPNGYVLQMPIRGTSHTICSDGYSGCAASTYLTWGEWHYVAATYDSADSVVRLFVDGVESAFSTPGGTILDTTASFVIAGHAASSDRNPLNGDMDELQMWCRALSPDEIRERGAM